MIGRRGGWIVTACTLALALAPAAPCRAAAPRTRPAGWRPPTGVAQIPLWPGAVPDAPATPPPRESVEVTPVGIAGRPVTMLHDVTVPTMTIVPPRGHATGAAMVVFPGGGFRVLAIDLEGSEVCDWVTAHGMTCILVKYRVPGSDTQWSDACACQQAPPVLRALQDAQRAIRLTRARAKALAIDPARIGVIGFSAGGYLFAQTSTILAPAYRPVDAIDRISSRPDFAVAAYPGHLCRDGGQFDPTIHVTAATPPTFIVQDWDDRTDAVCNSVMYAQALATAGVPAEVHLFAKGDHAFAFRRIGRPVDTWPTLLAAWLKQRAIL